MPPAARDMPPGRGRNPIPYPRITPADDSPKSHVYLFDRSSVHYDCYWYGEAHASRLYNDPAQPNTLRSYPNPLREKPLSAATSSSATTRAQFHGHSACLRYAAPLLLASSAAECERRPCHVAKAHPAENNDQYLYNDA